MAASHGRSFASLLAGAVALAACGPSADAGAGDASDRGESAADVSAEREGYVTTDDGVRLYYVEKGSGDDALVMPMAVYLADLLEPLADGRRVIFYDPRNRGRSDAAPLDAVSLDRQMRDLENLREVLGIDEMALLGWSGLGMEMAVYAIRHPDRVTRLVQVAAVPPAASIMREAGGDARDSRIDRDAVQALDERHEAGEFDGTEEDYCRERNRLTQPASFVDPSYVAQVPDLCALENEWPANLWPYFGAYLPTHGEDYDLRDALAELDVPRLVIHGEEDGIPVAGAYAWAEGFENARLIVVSPAGHFPFLEQGETVMGAIDTFLDGEWPEGAELVPAREG